MKQSIIEKIERNLEKLEDEMKEIKWRLDVVEQHIFNYKEQ